MGDFHRNDPIMKKICSWLFKLNEGLQFIILMKTPYKIVFSTEKKFLNTYLNVLRKIVDQNVVKMSLPLLVTSQVLFIKPLLSPI